MRVQEGLCDLRSGECNVVCFVLRCQWICLFCVFDSVRELFGETIHNMFGETIHNMFGCVCYYVFECDVVVCGWRCSIG